MGIRFYCPNGHKLNVKSFLAGQKGICPYCGVKVDIPMESTRTPGKQRANEAPHGAAAVASAADEEPLEMALPDVPAPHPAQPSIPSPVTTTTYPSSPIPVAPQSRMAPPHPVAASPVAVAPPAYPVPQPMAVPTPPAPPPPPPPPSPPSAGPPDPLTEAPDSVWYVRPPSGGQFGPAASSVMRGWLQEGRISADSLVWREGWRDWQEAIGVFPQLRGDDVALLNAVITNPVPAVVAAPMAIVAAQHRPTPRQRSKTTQVLVVALLVVVVLVLFCVFLWVLWREPEATGDKAQPPAAPHHTTTLYRKHSAISGQQLAFGFEDRKSVVCVGQEE